MRKHAIQSTLYIRTSTYIHGVHSSTAHSQARSLQPRHTRVSARPLALAQPRTRHDPSLRRSHPPLPPRVEENEVHQLLRVPILVLAVYDEHVSCARKHASHERHAHQQPGDRGVRMRLGRGSGPDGRRRPRGCRWAFRPTGGAWPSACERGHGACVPRPRPSAVWAGANYARAQTAVFASLRPPPARAWLVPCSNDNQTVGDKMNRTFQSQ